MKRSALALILAALVPAGQDDPFETRSFNVEILTRTVPDRRGEPFGLPGDPIGVTTAGDDFRPVLPEEFLIGLLKANVAEESWPHPAARIEFAEGALTVTQRRSVLARIAQVLDSLRPSLGKVITLDAWIVAADPAFLAPLRASAPAGRPAALGAEQARQLLEAAREGNQVELVKSLRISAHPGQRVHVGEGIQHAFLRDHDVQIASSAVALSPVIDVFTTGAGFDLTASIEPFGNTVLLEVRADDCELEAMEERKLKLLGTVPSPGQEAKPAEGPKDLTHLPVEAKVQLPRLAHDWVRTSVTAKSGETIVVGSVSKKGRIVVFLVTPVVLAVDDRPVPEPVFEEQRLLRLYDVSPLVRPIQDFRGPSTHLVSPARGGGGPLTGATFVLDEPRERMAGGKLEDLIRARVAPESWANRRNLIEIQGGHLLVVRQKPEVLKDIERMLGSLVQERSVTITTETVLVAIRKGARARWEKEIPALQPGGHFASEESIAKLLGEAARGQTARILAQAEITGFPLQRVHIAGTTEESYIQEFEPQVSTNAGQFDPIMGLLRTGVVLDAAPAFVDGTGRIRVALVESATSREMKEIAEISSGVGPVQLPRVSGPRWASDAICLPGQWTLLGIESRLEGGASEEVALFVRARANLIR